ncbi:WD domain-containing protein [Myxozyma melibiosi]|uniref:WD domain-containing protein n=1 Tax=Myxozyma melibiosi TaxID=54550 RepID=A0ABR1EZU1_9ASCO
MVKSYLRFEPDASFGVIASNSNLLWLPSESSAGEVVTGALESVIGWDVKKGEKQFKWNDIDIKTEVSCLASYDSDIFAVGYADGTIRVWDAKTETVVVSFNGHKSAVTVLKFDQSGTRLASGSRDSNIIVWDLIAEVGLYKLRSHKDQITGLDFIYPPVKVKTEPEEEAVMQVDDDGEAAMGKLLVSVSKDGFIKLWDLTAQHCMETHVAHRGECWAMSTRVDDESKTVVVMTAGGESELRVWHIDVDDDAALTVRGSDNPRVALQGVLLRQSKDRAVTVLFHPSAPFVAVHGTDRAVEILRIRTSAEVHKSVARKRRRRKEKGGDVVSENEPSESDVHEKYVPYVIVRASARVRSIDWASSSGESLQFVASLASNNVEMYSVSAPADVKKSKGEPPEYNRTYALELPGHRTDVRALSVSSDDGMIASAANGSMKIWNVKTTNCIRTFECGYALCCTFLPGDSIIVVGTKEGKIQLFDVASSTLLEEIDAHEGALWSLQVSADGRALVTGSADKTVKFWEFKVVQDTVPGTTRTVARMSVKHRRTLELSEDVLSVRLSPDSKYVAVSLLDNTIKVFYMDSLKFFLNLYGHKLPVLSMDISWDSKLLISSSADKNIKIWGLDFGDCHRSLFAHEDSIMAVEFAAQTHNFFSASKDGLVKYWDGDKFENIQKLEGHRAEVWAIAVAPSGEFVVSASHDKSIRIWMQTEDQVFLEEEREREMEELYEATLAGSLSTGDENGDEKEADEVTTAGGRQTTETLVAGERIAEALELGIADLERPAEGDRNIVFTAQGGISAEQYVLGVVEKVRAAQLQDALLLLPFDKIVGLLRFVSLWAEHGWNVPLATRVLGFLVRMYYKQIVANEVMRQTLDAVRTNLRAAVSRQRDEIGYNVAGLREVRRRYAETRERGFGEEEERVVRTRKREYVTVN